MYEPGRSQPKARDGYQALMEEIGDPSVTRSSQPDLRRKRE
jgi:hypothetical protein